MSDVRIFKADDGCRIAYRLDGAAGCPVLILSNSIATTLHMWDDQVAALTERFQVLRYDMRGHGRSDAPAGAYSLDRLGRDVLELMDGLGIDRAHFAGCRLAASSDSGSARMHRTGCTDSSSRTRHPTSARRLSGTR